MEKFRLMNDIKKSAAMRSVLTVVSEEQFLTELADELIRAGWTRPVKEGETLYTVAFGKVDEVKVTYAHTETTLEVRAGNEKLMLCDFRAGEGFYTDRKAAERELERRNKDESI